ncbi:MAG: hypothetical protein ACRDMH_04465 [Solirubrobacterales bacterium]
MTPSAKFWFGFTMVVALAVMAVMVVGYLVVSSALDPGPCTVEGPAHHRTCD